ncbi:MAG: Tol-Pal system beta propeller repeat protein TolB [candidate division WOR-3 bacterium]|nr:MAG: Tol-Pal system beta propeller repeat protein TolB [candidate division WOR-3 bacterium]
MKYPLILVLLAASALPAQDIYLRLTDYGGGKINLVLEPFTVEGPTSGSDFTRRAAVVEDVLGNDLEYSLYFEIVADTTFLQKGTEGVVLRATAANEKISVRLEDFDTREKISERSYDIEKDPRRTAHTIADEVIKILTGEKGIASTRILFSYRKSGGKEIGMIDYDGYNFTRITNNDNINLFPSWAPDGKRLLFSTYTNDRLNIYVYDISERTTTSLSSFRGLNFAPCWSPDGTKICMSLSKDGNAEIYVLDLETKKLHRLTNNSAIDTSPTFSPNSREIAFVSDRSGNPQIYVMDTHGGNVRRMTFHGNYNTSPAWSPRGDIIAYVSREKDNSQQIYVTDPTDFSPMRITYLANNEEPAWSPDGLHIVFTSNRTGQYELYTMNWDGSRLRKLTTGITANAPDWSPLAE